MAWFQPTYQNKSDEELMIMMKDHDQRAFGELYDRYSERLLNYFYRMLWKDREKAEDFMQDLFAKLIEKPELFSGERSFKTWVFSIANNMCKNAYRHHEVVGRANEHIEHFGERTVQTKVEKQMDRAQFDEDLDQVLAEMDDDKRTTFYMRYREELSIKEIAAALGCSEGTVKSRLFYTLKHLNKELKIYEGILLMLWMLILPVI